MNCYLFWLNFNLISYLSPLFIKRNYRRFSIFLSRSWRKRNLFKDLFLKLVPNVTLYFVHLNSILGVTFFQSSPVAKSIALTLLSDSYDRSIKLPYGTQKCIYLTAKNSCFDPSNQRRTIDVSKFLFCQSHPSRHGQERYAWITFAENRTCSLLTLIITMLVTLF